MLSPNVALATPQLRSLTTQRRKPEEASVLAQSGVPLSFGRNAEIFAEGETAGYVYKVISGVVRVSKLLPDGRRQISAFHMPGEMFGFEADGVHHVSAEAIVPTKVIAYKRERLVGDGKPGIVRELLNLAVQGLRHTQDHLLLLGRKNALERLAAFLLEMDARTGSKHVLDLAMPRHDIADYLGLTLETVSRMFAELKDLGMLELESARRVHLTDMGKLKAVGA